MRLRNIAGFGVALVVGAICGSLIGPKPAQAVAREIIELQRDVTTLLQGQKDLSTQMTQDHTVMRTVVQQSTDAADKLNGTMSGLQKSIQDVQANSGARLDTMSTQLQGLSDNLEEIKSRMGKLNQQLVDVQSAVQSIDAKVSGGGSMPPGATPTSGTTSAPPYNSSSGSSSGGGNFAGSPSAAAGAPSADTLYSNGLRDITSGKYDLAKSEFQDYLKYYGQTDLASNAQFYLGEIAYSQKQYSAALSEYDKVLNNYPKSFKLATARLKKGMALVELGQKTSGIRELREVVRRYPGTEEERRARAKLKELGASATATSSR